ncbi:hypothetical protein JCM5350_004476 [Sporobolomyces pararoseus]
MPTPYVPPELLEDIFSQLSSSKSALYHLSLSCKTFYHLCKPFLYTHITITTGEQRRKLKEVRKEDAQLVRKLVIKGEDSTETDSQEEDSVETDSQIDEADDSIGSGIIEDLFSGKLLDISVIEVLHLSHLFENVKEQSNFKTLELRAASNLVELSINYHCGGGLLWDHVLGDGRLCPSLLRLGSYGVWDIHPEINPYSGPRRSRVPGIQNFVDNRERCTLRPIWFHRHPLVERLEVLASACEGDGKVAKKNLLLEDIQTSNNFEYLPRMFQDVAHIHVLPNRTMAPPDTTACRRTLSDLQNNFPIKSPSFLSLPFSRSDFSAESLSTLSSIEELGIDLHFSPDEEEEDSISLIPQSFVKFVEKQKKLKEEKEKEKEQERA